MPSADQYVATTEFYVRYAETDAQGIVHHASYIVYMEEGRLNYARSLGLDYAEFERSGFFITVIGVQARYRAPSHYGDLIRVTCWVEELKSRMVTFGYEITNAKDNTEYTTGVTEHICLNRAGKPVPWPDEWKAKLDR